MSYPINAVKQIHGIPDLVHTDGDGAVWLLSGHHTTDTVTYPNAIVRKQLGFPDDNTLALSTNPEDATWDGTYLWIMCGTGDNCHRVDENGDSTGFSFATTAQATSPTGIVYLDGFLWVANDTGFLYKYNTSGVYQSVSWDLTLNDPEALFTDGTDLWVLDDSGVITQVDPATGTEGTTFDLAEISGIWSLANTWFGADLKDGVLWVLDEDSRVYAFDWATKTYMGVVAELNVSNNYHGFCFFGTDRYTFLDLDEDVIVFGSTYDAIGLGQYTEADNVPIYLRIK